MLRRLLLAVMLAQSIAMLFTATPVLAETKLDTEPLTIARQGSFFVGGREVKSDALSTIPQFSPQGTVFVDQMYVHYQIPHQSEVIRDHSGSWLLSDRQELGNHAGWSYGLGRVFRSPRLCGLQRRSVPAWPARPASPVPVNSAKVGKVPADSLPAFISAGQEGLGRYSALVRNIRTPYPGLQFPIEAQEEFWKQMVPDWNYSMKSPVPSVQARSPSCRSVSRAQS